MLNAFADFLMIVLLKSKSSSRQNLLRYFNNILANKYV